MFSSPTENETQLSTITQQWVVLDVTSTESRSEYAFYYWLHNDMVFACEVILEIVKGEKDSVIIYDNNRNTHTLQN